MHKPNISVIKFNKDIERHAAHTIASWPNPNEMPSVHLQLNIVFFWYNYVGFLRYYISCIRCVSVCFCFRAISRLMFRSDGLYISVESNETFYMCGCAKLWSTINYILHYADVIMIEKASQTTSLTVVYSIVNSGADQSKHQSSASLAFVRGIHRDRWIPRTKGPVTRKMFPFDDVIVIRNIFSH